MQRWQNVEPVKHFDEAESRSSSTALHSLHHADRRPRPPQCVLCVDFGADDEGKCEGKCQKMKETP